MKTLLVADDHATVLQLEESILRGRYRLLTASDGTTAYAKAMTEKPDAIVLDNIMPGMHGVDVAAKLRKAGYAGVIILVSVQAERAKTQAEGGTIDAFLAKPFRGADLLGLLDKHLG
jgi:DNA-binding response OmpR family regulator